jgi:hypothetical protein
MRSHLQLVTDVDIQIVLEFSTWLFKQMNLPLHGSLPVRKRHSTLKGPSFPDRYLATPVICEQSIRVGWWHTLTENLQSDTGYLTVPRIDVPTELPSEMRQGRSFPSKGGKVLGVLEKIGVVRKELLLEDQLVCDDVLERMERFMSGHLSATYEYHVLSDFEPWSQYYDRYVC